MTPGRGDPEMTRERESATIDVSTADRQAYPESAAIIARAFENEPTVCAILRVAPNVRTKRLASVFSIMMHTVAPRGWILQASKDGKLCGAAVMHPPGTYPIPVVSQLRITIRAVMRHGFHGLGRWMRLLNAYEKQHPKEPPHYYLELLGVLPEQQGQGIGSAMLRELTRRADAEQVGCYLETADPKNLPLYERFGFCIRAEQEVIGVRVWFMWRPG